MVRDDRGGGDTVGGGTVGGVEKDALMSPNPRG